MANLILGSVCDCELASTYNMFHSKYDLFFRRWENVKKTTSSMNDELLARILLDLYFYWLLPRGKTNDSREKYRCSMIRLDPVKSEDAVKRELESSEEDQDTDSENASESDGSENDTISRLEAIPAVSSQNTNSNIQLHLECDNSQTGSQSGDVNQDSGNDDESSSANQSESKVCSSASPKKENRDLLMEFGTASHALDLVTEQDQRHTEDASEAPIGQTSTCDAAKELNLVAVNAIQETDQFAGKEAKKLTTPKRRRGRPTAEEAEAWAKMQEELGSKSDQTSMQEETISKENDLPATNSPSRRKRGRPRKEHQMEPKTKKYEMIEERKPRLSHRLAEEKISCMAKEKIREDEQLGEEQSHDPQESDIEDEELDSEDEDPGYDMKKRNACTWVRCIQTSSSFLRVIK